MAVVRTPRRMASNAGFSLIEWLTVIAIAGLIALSAGQLIGAATDRAAAVKFQTLLMDRVEALWAQYLQTGVFPESVAPDPEVTFTLTSCGTLCRSLELIPHAPHACEYWRLSTDGTKSSGGVMCW